MALGVTAVVAGWVSVSMLGAAADRNQQRDAERDLARMAAEVEALKADTRALQGSVHTTAARIEQRQQFLDALLAGGVRGAELAELLPPARRGRAAPTAQAAAEAGVLAPFAQLEERQTAMVDRASATADRRIREAEGLLRRLGLETSRFVPPSSQLAQRWLGGRATGLGQGGPFVPAASIVGAEPAEASPADPRFAELFVRWQQVSQLEEAMQAIPAFMPVNNFVYTSGFGFRNDPFHGGRANHTGIDMAGAVGEPIMASAAGRVVRAANFGAYGLTVDIDHGRGILTRYAHLSRIEVRHGEKVAMGQRIGRLGSTGRSTGPHLHYEVRIDGRPVDPRPFLDHGSYILAMREAPVAGPR